MKLIWFYFSGAGNLEIIVAVAGRNVPNYVQSEGNARFKVRASPKKPSPLFYIKKSKINIFFRLTLSLLRQPHIHSQLDLTEEQCLDHHLLALLVLLVETHLQVHELAAQHFVPLHVDIMLKFS